jgi:uncharacterized phage-associated protein
MPSAKQVAEFFLSVTDPDLGDLISNLKLQKLVYYAQGFHLAMYEQTFFDEPILAWEHGPVVESLYHEYRGYGSNRIPPPENFNIDIFTEQQRELLNEVYEVYGQFSAWKLRNMTHSERPWIETPRNTPISENLMREYFKEFVS